MMGLFDKSKKDQPRADFSDVQSGGSSTAPTPDAGKASPPSTGAAVTEFHLSKPSAWPEGDYKVEILLNSASAGTRNFKVK